MAKPQDSGRIAIDGCDDPAAQACRIRRVVLVGFEFAGGWVEAVQSAIAGADPERALRIFTNATDIIKAQALGVIGIVYVSSKHAGWLVHFIQAIARANPERSGFVLIDVIDRFTNHALGIIGIELVVHEFPGGRVKAIQAGAFGPSSHAAATVFIQAPDRAAAQACVVARDVAIGLKLGGLAIQDIDPFAQRANP